MSDNALDTDYNGTNYLINKMTFFHLIIILIEYRLD